MKKIEHGHHPGEIADRLARGPNASYLRDAVYGGIDGAVTTFAVVAGVVGAQMSAKVVLILGIANLIADGFSMAAANFTGTRAEVEEQMVIREMEGRHIDHVPEGEREEVRQIFAAKGFEGKLLEDVVDVITSDRERWIDTMLSEEHGLPRISREPLRAAAVTFVAFFLCGAVPLIPFLLFLPNSFPISIAMTGVVFFLIGSLKSRWSPGAWWRSGQETLVIGLAAAGTAYIIGDILKNVWGVS